MALPTDANVDLLICDAAQQEPNGKLNLFGYFPVAEIKLGAGTPLPVALNLTFLFVLKDGDGQMRPVLRIVDPFGKELHRNELPEFRKLAGQAYVMTIAVQRIPVANSGNFSIVLEINGQAYRRPVRIFQ